jgi:5'-3' exonuclease
MGIPAFFRIIITKYQTTHFWDPKFALDHLFIDANSIIYNVNHALGKTDFKGSLADYEQAIIVSVIDYIHKLTRDICHVKKVLYIAFDGPVPRSKMVQQRARRYKGVMEDVLLEGLHKKHGIAESSIKWSRHNISPATDFMVNLSKQLHQYIDAGNIAVPTVILSDSSVAGEGEHKFMHMIREMRGSAESIGIYSPDADQIVLAMTTHKSNIFIVRPPPSAGEFPEIEEKYHYIADNAPIIYLSIDEYRKSFVKELTADLPAAIISKLDHERLITDYCTMLSLAGNDHVVAISYLKVNKESTTKSTGLKVLLGAYKAVLLKAGVGTYLVEIDNDGRPKINHRFFRDVCYEISKNEDKYMLEIKRGIDDTQARRRDARRAEKETDMSPFELEWSRLQHLEYYHPDHPEFRTYRKYPIDYSQTKHVWREQYYREFVGISMNNVPEFNRVRSELCKNYLDSVVFTMLYYFGDVPSWSFYYRYRCPPLLSDLVINLDKYISDMNDTGFVVGQPYTPLQQLMLIMPKQLGMLLPKEYAKLMHTDLLPYYPDGWVLDVWMGGKMIYSEPLLPELYEDEIFSAMDGVKIAKKNADKNILTAQPHIYRMGATKNSTKRNMKYEK